MSSLVELIFTAVGTEQVARSVGQVNASMGEMVDGLGRMATAALSVDLAWGKLKGAIDEGAAFEHLAARTGENVRALVVLDQAFRNAGLGAEMIGLSANMLQRSLGGVNDMGGKTETAFRRIGTSIAELKPLSYAQQLDVLSKGFANLANQSDRVSVARELFGRGGGQMLQLLGDPAALARAEEQAGGLANRIGQNARAAQDLEVAFNGVTAKLREMWQAAAAQLLPALQAISDLLGHLSLGGVGSFLGSSGAGLLGAGALLFSFNKIDSALYGMLAKMEEGTARSLVRGVSNGMADAAAWNPYLLAAAVTVQIVAGIVNAWNDAQIQRLFADAQGRSAPTQAIRDRAAKDLTPEQQAETLAAAQAKLNQLLAERVKLAGQLEANRKGTENYDPDAQDKFDTNKAAVTKLAAYIATTLANPVQAAATLAANQLAVLKQQLLPLVGELDKLEKKNAELRLKEMSPFDRVVALQGQGHAIEAQLGNVPAGLSPDEAKARRLDLENKLLKIQIEQHQAAQQLTEEFTKHSTEKQKQEIFALTTQMMEARAAGDTTTEAKLKREIEYKQAVAGLSGKELELALQRLPVEERLAGIDAVRANTKKTMEAEKLALENQLTSIRENLSTLEADYTRTAQEKWGERKKAIADEIAALSAARKLEQDRAAAATDPVVKNQHEQAAAGLGRQLAGAQGEQARQGPDPNNWVQQTINSLTKLKEAAGTTAEQIGRSISTVIGGAFNSVTQNLTQAIVRTGDFHAAIGNIAVSIEESIVGAIVDMGAKWVMNLAIMGAKWLATKLGMLAADQSVAAASLAAMVPMAAATALLWSTPATLVTIASFGGAAAAAPAEMGAAIAAGHALAFASEGGYFPGDPTKPRGVFHGDEFVFSAPAVRAIGAGNLAAQHRAALSPAAGSAALAGGSAGGSRDSARNIHVYLDRSAWLDAVQNDLTGIAHEVYDRRSRA